MTIKDFNLPEKLNLELSNVIALRKLPHAIIIESTNKQERNEFAYFLSAAALCESEGDIPCGKCKNCMKIFNKIHPDVSVYEKEADKKEFSVKIVKTSIISDIYIKPNEANGKICIIKDADLMNINAQNALLKIFEEPPTGVKFILCCESAANMLETIRSRATVYSLNSGSEAVDEDKETAKALAKQLANALVLPTEYDFMALTGAFEKNRELLALVFGELQIIFRDCVAYKSGMSVEDEDGSIAKISSAIGLSALVGLIEKINELYGSLNKNANLNLLLTRFSSVLRQSARG